PSHFAALQKMGNRRNSLRSDTPVSDPFSVTQQNAASRAGVLQKQLQQQLQSNCKATAKSKTPATRFSVFERT
ncbi:hypothetical protein, partial [Undibacterium sp.]|uniref:hypothetical protein n=1 Tax=Undibacterium sp. TaxID=1914977 RepID=UPI00374DE3BA